MGSHPTALFIRGGGGGIDQITNVLSSSLESGPTGVLALWAIATCVITPLTLYRTEYGFTVGYGFGVMALGASVLKRFSGLSGPPLYLVTSVVFYGARLGLFLTLRNLTMKKERRNSTTSPLSKRLILGTSLALFYSFMVTPALYAARGAGVAVEQQSYLQKISMTGAGIAWVGVIIETLADAQKYVAKIGCDEKVFVGPTGGFYRLCRHPNYLGELMYWFGLFLGGAPAYGVASIGSIVPWLCSFFGLFGIYGIITGATKRLETKQKETYGGQDKYDKWRARVTSPIFPFVKDA